MGKKFLISPLSTGNKILQHFFQKELSIWSLNHVKEKRQEKYTYQLKELVRKKKTDDFGIYFLLASHRTKLNHSQMKVIYTVELDGGIIHILCSLNR